MSDSLLSIDIRCLHCGAQILLLRSSLGWEHLQSAVAAQTLPAHHTCVSG